ncbi:MAG: hypothetical protein LBP80_01340 [Treponema sp.]|jgi:uncharacterized integral membrane protein|nr:hypothetical protein [Treponema sp.]
MFLKFIGFVALCAVFLVFIGFNLENKCDISFGFTKLSDVPVFFTAFASFVLGLLASVPIAVSIRLRKNRKQNREKAEVEEKTPYKNDGTYGVD